MINQCIGVRNHRAFVLCLIMSWVSFLWMFGYCLWDIFYYDFIENGISKLNNNKTKKVTLCITLDSIVVGLVLIKLLVNSCSNWISHGQYVIWLVAEIVVVQALYLININNWDLNVTGFLLCIGSSGVYLIWGPMKAHVKLTFLGMTMKE